MSDYPTCECCRTTIWTEREIDEGVCSGCRSISRNPGRFTRDPSVDVALICRRVRSIDFSRSRRPAGTRG